MEVFLPDLKLLADDIGELLACSHGITFRHSYLEVRMIMPTWPIEQTQAWTAFCTPHTAADAEAVKGVGQAKSHWEG